MATKPAGATGEVASGTMEGVESAFEYGGEWQGGVVAGLAGGLLMGVLMSTLSPGTLDVAIPALVGLSGGLAGWVVHMSISAVFGVAFAAVLARSSLRRYGESVRSTALAGLTYGVVLTVVAAGVVMPLWLGVVGFEGAPAVFSTITATSLLNHLAYGLVLGATYPALVRQFRPEAEAEPGETSAA